MNLIIQGDFSSAFTDSPRGQCSLVYIDPPYNTGTTQRLGKLSYEDKSPADEWNKFMRKAVGLAEFLLADNGSLFIHCDWHCYLPIRCIVEHDISVGGAQLGIYTNEERSFTLMNDIVWAYDYGGRPKTYWPRKHDNILWYAKNPDDYIFNYDEMERIPYMAPGLVGKEKAARGKTPTDCYSDDTEVLTENGWRLFVDVSHGERVATVDEELNLSYVEPTKFHSYHYNGEMIHLCSKTVDLLVTPNHRVWARRKHGSKAEFIRAEELRDGPQYVSIPNKLHWTSHSPQVFEVPSVIYERPGKLLPPFTMEDWCEFMGWYLAEGCCVKYADRKEVHITQLKNKDDLEALLRKMGLTNHYNGRSFVICNKQLYEYLHGFGYAHEKFIARHLLHLGRSCLQRLYNGLMAGDGHVKVVEGQQDGHVYTTTSTRLANDVHELLIKLGFNASTSLELREQESWRDIYRIYRRVANESTIWKDRHISTVPYDGMVYCLTVEPHHTLVVRRNGRSSVCGNCWWHTIVPTNGKERTGYPTQKPMGVLERIIRVHSNPGDTVIDFFAGSGTTGAAALKHGRDFVLVDNNPQAIEVMQKRFNSEAYTLEKK